MYSNMTTLALTAAVSVQLEQIEQQLTEIRETLDKLVADNDRKRLAEAVAANRVLQSIADGIVRRGEITDADWDVVAANALPVAVSSTEIEFKFQELLNEARTSTEANRAERAEFLRRLLGSEGLEYWLALRVEVELAQSRWDLLKLYWEQSRHPETAQRLVQETQRSLSERRERLSAIGDLLDELADPRARDFVDKFRQLKRRDLEKKQTTVRELLSRHGEVFGRAATPKPELSKSTSARAS